MTAESIAASRLYRTVWRWHFYAGLFVMPFLLVLSLSGLSMLVSKPLDSLSQKHLNRVDPVGQPLSATSQLAIVREHFPDARVQLYIPPGTASAPARFAIAEHGGGHGQGGHNAPTTTVYLNPYTGGILGTLDPAKTLYARLKTLHGTLFLGDFGDSLVEIAAGLAVLLVLTGIYLAWPREGWRGLIPRLAASDREDWRSLHRIVGLLVAIPLLFFLVSGLAWTNVWGGKLVQAWSSLPGSTFQAPEPEHTHQSMNREGLHRVPWAMEQTPLPASGPGAGGYNLDAVVAAAAAQGFGHFRVNLPRGDAGVWTISATTIAGDLTNPLAERTLHLDRSSGRVLADFRFADYPAMGKAMSAFIPLHQGDLGLWNWLLNLCLAAMVVFVIASGFVMWWKRRPRKEWRLAPPAAPPGFSRAVVIAMLVVALCFPLSAAVMAVVIVLDWLLISRVARLRTALK